MTSRPDIVPVILVGGRDARLWPLTNSKRPKEFLSLGTGLSFFQRTALRGRAFSPPIIVCHQRYEDTVYRQMAQIKMEPRTVLLEPDHRGTAAAIGVAAHLLKGIGALMLVQPGDQSLKNVRAFEKGVIESIAYTIENMVLFGVKPMSPESDYGYIVMAEGDRACRPVRRFIEKPDVRGAKELIARGDCLWNTGMFLTRPSVFLQLLERSAPKIYGGAQKALAVGTHENVSIQLNKKIFSEFESVSVDIVLLKRISSAFVRDLDVEWSDIGSWWRLFKWRREERAVSRYSA